MKKPLFILGFLALSATSVSAQGFAFGPRAGFSQTKLSLKKGNFIPGDAEVGFHVGAFARFGAAGLYVQPELLYTQTSGTFSFDGPSAGGNASYAADFNRLDIPVMVGFKILKILRVQVGPIASFNLNTEVKDVIDTVQDIDFAKSTIGYQAGLGVDIGNLYLDAKYEGGLSSITDQIGQFETDQRVNQWVFSLGFKLF